MIPNLNKTQRLAFMQDKAFEKLWQEADEAGIKAGNDCIPEEMIVTDGKQEWHVSDGVCGFAWISFAGNTAFGRWARRCDIAQKQYGGGLRIWCHLFGQSMTRKEEWAWTVSAYLWDHAQIIVNAGSRID